MVLLRFEAQLVGVDPETHSGVGVTVVRDLGYGVGVGVGVRVRVRVGLGVGDWVRVRLSFMLVGVNPEAHILGLASWSSVTWVYGVGVGVGA